MLTTLFDKLRKVTNSLLDHERPAYSLREAVLELKSIFEEAGGAISDPAGDISRGETITDQGIAISPTMASMCVDDFARTIQFIRGAHATIRRLRDDINDRPVRVLYAGCGPWAPLAIPLMTIFTSYEVIFTLLDIHSDSIDSVNKIRKALGVHDHCIGVTANAMNYLIDENERPDIVLVEMMRAGLESEPQVAVSMHLMQQVPDAILIPDEIRTDLALVNSRREFAIEGDVEHARDRIMVGTVIVVDKNSLAAATGNNGQFPAVQLVLPDSDESRYRPMLLTSVRVVGEYHLQAYDAGITCPKSLSVEGGVKPGDSLEFRYEFGSIPGLTVNRS